MGHNWRHGLARLIGGILMLAASAASAASFLTTPRSGHTSTLLPDGNILVCGGISVVAGSCEIFIEQRGTYIAAADMGTARSSHTATLLPNGQVLVAGGFSAGAAVVSTELYDPMTNAWTAGPAMTTARFHHTATLLKNGLVLLCGGQNVTDLNVAVVTASCELYIPGVPPAIGSISAAPSLATARTLHSATLLPNGRVFITGGYNSLVAPPHLANSEIYNADMTGPDYTDADSMGGAHSLATGRSSHTATAMGDGRVLIIGGCNVSSTSKLGANGMLDSAEIYDPVHDSIAPAARMLTRNMAHTATLMSDGNVQIFGGLGNVTTTFAKPTMFFESGSYLLGPTAICPVAAPDCITIDSGPLMVVPASSTLRTIVDLTLNTPVSGIIQSGEILFSTPSVTYNSGVAYFTPGVDENLTPNTGLKANLAGTRVYCDATGACGRITELFHLRNVTGSYQFSDLAVIGGSALISNGGIGFSPTPILSNSPDAFISGNSTLTFTLQLTGLPGELIGGVISSGTLNLSGKMTVVVTADTEYTVTITSSMVRINPPVPIVDNGAGAGVSSPFLVTMTSITGTVITSTDTTPQASRINGSILTASTIENIAGTFTGMFSRVDVSGKAFKIDVATVIIKSMVFSDLTEYSPRSNAWTFQKRGFGSQRWGHAATLAPNGSIRFTGGKTLNPNSGRPCSTSTTDVPDCATTFGAAGSAAIGDLADNSVLSAVPALPVWKTTTKSMSTVRGNHTSTLLPTTGQILIAGGTDGPNILASAELFNLKTQDVTPAQPMNIARDLHSATLLPNGRVLVAGGFSMNALSTGPTSSAEMYFPDTGVWQNLKPMNTARDQHSAVLLPDGNVLVMGGFNNTGYLDSAEIYYSTAGEWKTLPNMCVPRARFTATLLQNKNVLVAGGINAAGILGSSCLFNGVAWSVSGSLANSQRTFLHAASLLANGNVLIAGGSDGQGETAISQIYNTLSGAWTTTVGTITARYNHTMTALPNGKILAIGGAQGLNKTISLVEIFDLGTSSWTVSGFLTGNRAQHTTIMSPGNVLFTIGGFSGVNYNSTIDTLDLDAEIDSDTPGAPPSIRISSIALVTSLTTATPNVFFHDSTVTLRGSNFMGFTEASGGGAGGANSSHFHPRVVLQAVDSSGGSSSQGNSGFLVDLTTRVYNKVPSNPAANSNSWDKVTGLAVAPSSITIKMPGNAGGGDADERGLLPAGWYHMRLINNSVFSKSALVRVGPELPADTATGITSTPLSTRTARFDWSWPATALAPDGYNLYLASTGVLIATVPYSSPSSSYVLSGMSPNTTAQISIAAFNMTGDGPKAAAPSTFTFSTVPISVAFTNVTFSALRLNWNVNENMKGTFFEISQSTDDPSSNGKQPFTTSYSTPATVGNNYSANTNNTTNFFDVGSLTPNTTYYYRIRAYNASFVPSNFSVIIGTITRAAVENLTGSRCNGGVDDTYCLRWTWKPVVTNGFKVYSSSSNDVMANIAPGIFQYDQLGLGTNTAHSVRVSALGSGGEGPLAISATNYTYAATPIELGPPIIFYGTATLTLAWGRNQNPFNTAFEVSIGSFNVKETTFTTNDNSETVSFTASNLIPAEVYIASVSAFNEVGARSGYLRISTTVASTDAREVSNLRIITATPSSISVAWDRNGNASTATFSVRYSSDNFVSNISTWIAFSDNFNGLAATISGLSTNVSYTIRVTARSLNLRESIAVSTKTTTPSGGALQGSLSGLTSPLRDVLIDGTLGNGRYVSLYIPAGAYPIPVSVTISSIANTAGLCPGATNVSISVTVEPELDPVVPVILSMRYRVPPEVPENELGNIDPLLLTVFRRDTLKGSCVPMKTSVDTTARLINVTLNKLTSLQSQSTGGLGALDLSPLALNGSFMAGEVIPSAGVDGARIFPNPFTPRRESFMTFLNMPANARIRIYSMRGDLVYDRLADAKGMLTWPGLNKSGREVASGVYFAIIEHVGATLPRKTLKLVVHR